MALKFGIVKAVGLSFKKSGKIRSDIVRNLLENIEEVRALFANGEAVTITAEDMAERYTGATLKNGLAGILNTPAMVAGRGLVWTVKTDDHGDQQILGVRDATDEEKAHATNAREVAKAKAKAKKAQAVA